MSGILHPNQTIKDNCLYIGGVNTVELSKKYGTPLYVMDEDMIRETCREFRGALATYIGEDTMAVYAGKAFCTIAMCRLIDEEGLGLDVVSGGELYTAIAAGFPPERIYFHGNNKTASEISMALDYGIGRFVVDNLPELHMLNELSQSKGVIAPVSFRIKPGIDAHTFEAVMTGQIDSKFGVALDGGEAFDIIKTAKEMRGVKVEGIHCHIGSQIFTTEPYLAAAQKMLEFMDKVKKEISLEIRELNLGGGFGVKYTEADAPLNIDFVISKLSECIKAKCAELSLDIPRIVIEPGRRIAAQAGVTLYTVGSVKKIEGIRTYVAVDGGMTDNPRFALYEAEYSALAANKAGEERGSIVTLAGRCCESGDIIGRDMTLQEVTQGDIIAVLSTGAYNYSMASNYNRIPRPPVVFISGGEDRAVVRRETYDDIIRCDL